MLPVVVAEILKVKLMSIFELCFFFSEAFLIHKACYVVQIDFLITADPHADIGSIVYFQYLAQLKVNSSLTEQSTIFL